MLLNYFCNSKNKDEKYYLKKKMQRTLSRELLEIKPPDSTTRTPRSFGDRNYFKANEFEEYFIHYFPIILQDKLKKNIYFFCRTP